jgi:hypothetical protein
LLRRFHSAAANWERAELWVHTNTTRGAVRRQAGMRSFRALAFQAQVSAPMVPLGPHPLDHSGLVGQLHVVRQQVAGQPQLSPDFAR